MGHRWRCPSKPIRIPSPQQPGCSQLLPGARCGLSLPSAFRNLRSLYMSVRKRLLTRVDFPSPDSPGAMGSSEGTPRSPSPRQPPRQAPTCHHEREVEALLHRLAMDLVGERGKPHVLLVVLQGEGMWNRGRCFPHRGCATPGNPRGPPWAHWAGTSSVDKGTPLCPPSQPAHTPGTHRTSEES